MAMGHKKVPDKDVMPCPKCGKQMKIGLMGKTWRSTKLKAYYLCDCGQERILVKVSGHKVIKGNL